LDGRTGSSPAVSVSILLRLLPAISADPTAPSGLTVRGQAEVVETGETAVFKDSSEMLAFLMKVTDSHKAPNDDALGGTDVG
jgi:hypothetical protein